MAQVTFYVNVPGSRSQYTYQWERDGAAVVDNAYARAANLELFPLTPQMAGV